jgi:hypothetical protein
MKSEVAMTAPVEPALTKASPSPLLVERKPTTMDDPACGGAPTPGVVGP